MSNQSGNHVSSMSPKEVEKKSFAFSIVIDVAPRFYVQSLVLYWTLREYLSFPENNIHYHFVRGVDQILIDYFHEKGIHIHIVEPWSSVSPPCNKLRQLENPQLRQYDYLVLSDCDKIYYKPILDEINGGMIKACQFVARPGFEVFEKIYDRLGIPFRNVVNRLVPSDVVSQDSRTPFNNLNGGTYIVPSSQLDQISELWIKYANWLIENKELMGCWTRNIDQVALCMVMDSLGQDMEILSKHFDLGPGAKRVRISDETGLPEIGAIHYHARMTESGMLWPKPMCNQNIVEKMMEANALIEYCTKQEFPLYTHYAGQCGGLWL